MPWFRRLPAGAFAADFRARACLGKPVLTWFQGSGTGGEDVICNVRYQQIATVKPANGYLPGFHEFLITPWNTALLLADTIGTANLTSLGLSAHQQVTGGVVQEIDIKTGKLPFQWVSCGHVPYGGSHAPRVREAWAAERFRSVRNARVSGGTLSSLFLLSGGDAGPLAGWCLPGVRRLPAAFP